MSGLPLASALFVAFALGVYQLLDGFDLGVGHLLLFEREEALRDRMVASITPTWDGNETWLIMAGVGLLAAFPIAYGILMPAFYLPLVIMLMALGMRGVSFEFRLQRPEARAFWDRVFATGSVIASLAQGAIVGGLLEGVAVAPAPGGWAFVGGVADLFRPLALLSAVAVLTTHAALGAAWLHLKTTARLGAFAKVAAGRLVPTAVVLAIAVWIAAAQVVPGVATAWVREPGLLGLCVAAFLVAGIAAWWLIERGPDGAPFLALIAMVAAGLAGLGITIFPDVIPFRLSLWQAASGTSSHVFFLVGAGLVTPMVLGYTAFAYHVFGGKTPIKRRYT